MKNSLTIYRNIREKHIPMPQYQQGEVNMEKQFFQFDEHDEMISRIAKYKNPKGWLCFQSQALIISGNQIFENRLDNSGLLLTGEFITEEKSVHIRQTSTGWLLNEMKDEPSDDDNNLFYDTQYLSTESDASHTEQFLNYRVYQRCSNRSEYQTHACRFMGFSKGE